MKSMRKLILVLVLGALCVSALGCNTVQGVGRDIEVAGEALQDAVD
jgi:predicted small secreted protein